jgi:hypothetical protein
MEHHVEVTRTHSDDAAIPDALHLRCSCGWTSSAHAERDAQQLVREHVASGIVPAPAPYVPSPS